MDPTVCNSIESIQLPPEDKDLEYRFYAFNRYFGGHSAVTRTLEGAKKFVWDRCSNKDNLEWKEEDNQHFLYLDGMLAGYVKLHEVQE